MAFNWRNWGGVVWCGVVWCGARCARPTSDSFEEEFRLVVRDVAPSALAGGPGVDCSVLLLSTVAAVWRRVCAALYSCGAARFR
jgi:hypothetical protein